MYNAFVHFVSGTSRCVLNHSLHSLDTQGLAWEDLGEKEGGGEDLGLSE